MIEGVQKIKLTTHTDERGFFREILHKESLSSLYKFGQLSYSKVYEGVIKAWHGHKLQGQWTFVMHGGLKIKLYDNRSGSSTYKNLLEFNGEGDAEPVIYFFPPGVLHGYKCISGPALVLYLTSDIYDPEEEVRIMYNDPSIGCNWTENKTY